jgi:hypothetical protein
VVFEHELRLARAVANDRGTMAKDVIGKVALGLVKSRFVSAGSAALARPEQRHRRAMSAESSTSAAALLGNRNRKESFMVMHKRLTSKDE